MNRQTTFKPQTYLVELNGPLNAHWAEKTVQIFREVIEQGAKQVVVSLEKVNFIDSRGLLALLTGFKMFENDIDNFRLVELQPQIRLFFRLTQFDKVFQLAEVKPCCH
jgi:anti-anti-sigma factor